MNDNYLWDRTGQPDAEVQELEELLGTLRFQPRLLEIPATMKIGRKRSFIPLAIAAGIALLMLAGGLWIRLANSNARPTIQAKSSSQSAATASNQQLAAPDTAATLPLPPREVFRSRRNQELNQRLAARNVRRPVPTVSPALTREELAQKEQVLTALRLVSAKLNLVQRKSQGLPQVNAIRNQHKIG